MATSKTPILPTIKPFESQQQEPQSVQSALKWRQKQLLVSTQKQTKQPHLPALESKQWLVECLQRSSIRLIRLDADLGEASLKFWLDACEQANKPVFLRLPNASKLPKHRRSMIWWLKWTLDWSAAALLLLILSPVILGLICLIRIQSSGPIFCWEWGVGEQGKVFRLLKFRTTVGNSEALENQLMSEPNNLQKYQDAAKIPLLGHWMCNYGLDKLPHLFNVLRGEMRLVSSRLWTLNQVLRQGKEEL